MASACTGSAPESSASRPRFEAINCPIEVSTAILLEHRCGFLTVPEDRSKPAGRTIEVFAVVVEPPGQDAPPDPLFSLGGELGEVLDYGGIVGVAERVHRRLVLMEPRGTLRSEPSLVCPEVETAERDLLAMATTDPDYDATFLTAVSACYERLVGEGVDPSAYNVSEIAADAEDLRRALEVDEWNVTAIGDTSLVALELMRRFPQHLRSVILDSPVLPPDGGFATAADSTTQAVEEVDAACRAQSTCAANFPDVVGALDEAIAQLDERPVRFTTTGDPDAPAEIVIDGGMLVRLLRWYAAGVGGAWNAEVVPAMVFDALHGRYFATFDLSSNHVTCVGYHAHCGVGAWTQGLYYSVHCHDHTSAVPPEMSDGDPVSEALSHPYGELCRAWPVGGAEPRLEVVQSDVPTLMLYGSMDPLVSASSVEQTALGLSRSFVVSVPGEDSNVFSAHCPRHVRDLWIDDPVEAPDTTCLDEMSPPVFIAPLEHDGRGGAAIPDGTFRTTVVPEDGPGFGLDEASAAGFSGTLTLSLDDGRFQMDDPYDVPAGPTPRRDRWVGVYRDDGRAVTFVVDRPFIFSGLAWTNAWKVRDDSMLLDSTRMSSREDAHFFGDPGYLAVFSMWMESHPWRRVEPAR